MILIEEIIKELSVHGVKTIALLFIFLFFQIIGRKKEFKQLKFIKFIILLLLSRDLLYSVSRIVINIMHYTILDKSLFILLISDLAVLLLYLFWLRDYTGKRKYDLFLITFNIICGIFIILNVYIFHLMGIMYRLLYISLFIFNSIYLSINLSGVTEYNTEDSEIILTVRRIFYIAPIIYGIITYLIIPPGREGIIFQSLLIAVSYIVHAYVLSQYDESIDREKEGNIRYLSNDLESLFEFMRVLGSAIVEKIDIEQILNYIIGSTIKTSQADAGTILLVDEYEDILKVKTVNGFFPPLYPVPEAVKPKISSIEAYFKSTPIRFGETIFGEVASSGKPLFIKNSQEDTRLKYNTKNDTLFVNAVIIIPLKVAKRVLGVLCVLKRDRGKTFTDYDFEHLKTYGEYVSLTIDFVISYRELLDKREMEREIGIAADIQNKLLPKKIPQLKGIAIEAYSKSARGVSGDYYDILKLRGNRLGLVICDVAGKGVPAALVMVMIRSILHLITNSDKEVASMMTWINRGISGQIDIDHYATMSILSFDQSNMELIYSNAAHHPMLLYRNKNKVIEQMDTEGLPIGIEKTTIYGQKRVKLKKGDILALYTDGIIEAMNIKGEQYTFEKFESMILKYANLGPKGMMEKIKEDLSAFVGDAKQHDDQTLILMRVN